MSWVQLFWREDDQDLIIWKVTASPIKEHYRPAVKFRKIDKAVLERLQTGASDTTLAQAEVVEFQDNDSDVDEPSTEPEGNSADRDEVGGEKLAFVIDPQIDINSRTLLDMISEEAMVQVDQPLPLVFVTDLWTRAGTWVWVRRVRVRVTS